IAAFRRLSPALRGELCGESVPWPRRLVHPCGVPAPRGESDARPRPGQAIELSQLSRAADERGVANRRAPGTQRRSARRNRRTWHRGHGGRAEQRDLRGDGQAPAKATAADGPRDSDTVTFIRRQAAGGVAPPRGILSPAMPLLEHRGNCILPPAAATSAPPTPEEATHES